MIILEGPDKAGKSTLAKAIVEHYGATYFHFDNPRAGICHIDQFCDEIEKQPFNTVFDRGCLSALVYDFKSPTDSTRIMTTVPMMSRGIDAMKKHHALLIYVRPPDAVLSQRLKDEGDANDYVNEREMLFTAHVYDLIWDWLIVEGLHNKILYDSDCYSVKQIMKNQEFYIKQGLTEAYHKWFVGHQT